MTRPGWVYAEGSKETSPALARVWDAVRYVCCEACLGYSGGKRTATWLWQQLREVWRWLDEASGSEHGEKPMRLREVWDVPSSKTFP